MSSQIEKLYLNGYKSSPIDVKDHLFLKELCISCIDKIIPSVTELFLNLPSLNTLSIDHGTICYRSASSIVNFISDSQLLKLELVGCSIRNDLLISIIDSAAQSSLQILNFHYVSFTDEAAMAIVRVLEKNTQPLIKLSLIGCEFRCQGLISIMDAIKKSKLQTLILDHSRIEDNAIMSIADCIAHAKLIKLSLRSIWFETRTGRATVDAIKTSSLKTLDVRDCHFFTNFNVINCLMSHQTLTKFKYSEHKLNIEERWALLYSIQENCLLEHISFNRDDKAIMTDQLVTKMCDLLKNPRFTSLDIDCTWLSDYTLKKIMDAIKQSSITSLQISASQFRAGHMILTRDPPEKYNFLKLKLQPNVCMKQYYEQILFSVQRSSVIKFDIMSMGFPIVDEIQHKIELILQPRRQSSGHHIKSARL